MENFETLASEVCLSVFQSLFRDETNVWSALSDLAKANPQASLRQAVQGLQAARMIGVPLEDALQQSELFRKPQFSELVILLKESDLEPKRAAALWLAWACKNGRVSWTDGRHWTFLKAFLNGGGALWLAGESAQSVEKVFSHCQKLSPVADVTGIVGEDCESLKLQCKRGKLVFSQPRIALWIETDTNGDPVITRVDELVCRKAGVAPAVQAIYWLGKRLELEPTGFLPSCIEVGNGEQSDLSIRGQKLDASLFATT